MLINVGFIIQIVIEGETSTEIDLNDLNFPLEKESFDQEDQEEHHSEKVVLNQVPLIRVSFINQLYYMYY